MPQYNFHIIKQKCNFRHINLLLAQYQLKFQLLAPSTSLISWNNNKPTLFLLGTSRLDSELQNFTNLINSSLNNQKTINQRYSNSFLSASQKKNTPFHYSFYKKCGHKNLCIVKYSQSQFHSCAKMELNLSTSSPIGIKSLSSPMSPPNSFSSQNEGDDDIGALSAGFDRRRTLRRKLSTVFDSPPENDVKNLEKLMLSHQKHSESINEESDESESSQAFDLNQDDEKPKDLKITDVLEQLQKIIEFSNKKISHIIIEKAVKDLCTAYTFLDEPEKLQFFNILALKYSVDHESVKNISKSLVECNDENVRLNIQERLRGALVAKYQWLFSQIGRLEGGVKFLVDFRTDLGEISQKFSDTSLHLKTMNNAVKDLIAMWFAVGFLNLERVTWESSCEMLQKISEYEAVHPMRNWTDLKRRVGNYRRCFVFTHGSMPREPVVVLHTALTDHIPSSIGYIVTNSRIRMMSVDSNSDLGCGVSEDARSITTAIFYSITSTQKGLAGIELGNYLIKRVVRELKKELPKICVFCTLSPIPGFRSWFLNELKQLSSQNKTNNKFPSIFTPSELSSLAPILSCGERCEEVGAQIGTLISQNDWADHDKLGEILEGVLMRHCARYLVEVKRRGFALNSVANFHLKNGAVIWRLNWRANLKPRGLSESCGIMVNYRYFLDDCENNSQEYIEKQTVKISDQVKHLLRPFKNDIASPQ